MMPGVENLESYSLDGKGMVYNKSSHGEEVKALKCLYQHKVRIVIIKLS